MAGEGDELRSQLEELRDRCRLLEENSQDVIWAIDLDMRLTYLSPAFEAITGHTVQAGLSMSLTDMFTAESAKRCEEAAAQVIADERLAPGSFVEVALRVDMRHVDGRGVSADIRCTPLRDECGKLIGLQGSTRDTSERSRAQELARQSEERYRGLFEEMLYGAALHEVILDEDGAPVDYRYLSVNSKFEEATGLTADRVLGRTVREVLPNIEHEWIERFGRAALTGEPARFEMYAESLDAHFEVSAFRVAPMQFVVVFADVSEYRHALDRLAASEERYRRYIESAPHGVFVTDENGRYIQVNQAACEMTGYTEDELLSLGINDLVAPEAAEEQAEGFGKLRTERRSEREVVCVREDGKQVTWTIKAFRAEEDRYIAFAEDITERLRAEEAQRKLEARVQHSQRLESMGVMAGGIAHDFNNILGAVLGYAELASDTIPDNPDAQDYLEQVLKGADRAKDLIQQILTFSRQAETEKQDVALAPILKEALKLVRSSLPATIEIAGDIQADDEVVHGDPTQLHQVVMNLCTNAHHAMRDSGGRLEAALTVVPVDESLALRLGRVEPGPHLKLSIRDSGCGMDRATKERIFEPFFTTKQAGEGTGLGLSTCYGIVADHGGAISVYSEIGQGTVFQVYLPCAECSSQSEGVVHAEPGQGTGRVLVVDDEPALRAIAEKMLESLGYTVVSADSSQGALAAFRASPDEYDVLITDYTMPKMTGTELARAVKELRPNIPVVLVTGSGPQVAAQASGMGDADALLLKPYTRAQLAETVRRALPPRSP